MGSQQSPDITAEYLAHLRATIQDLRRVRDDLRCELKKTRAQAWQRGLIAAELHARVETERRNAELFFELLVEAEAKLAAR